MGHELSDTFDSGFWCATQLGSRFCGQNERVRSAPQAVEKSHGIFIEAHGWATGIRWSHRLYESIFKSQQTTDSHFS